MNLLMTVFAGPYAMLARIGVMALACAALFGYGYFKGNVHGTAKLEDYKVAQATESTRIAVRRAAVSAAVVTRYVQAQKAAETVERVITKEVVQYETSNSGACLDNRWRVLHDAAATRTVPDSPARIDDTGTAPTAAAALETVTGNYSVCGEIADRLTALQAWVTEQGEVK